MSASRQAVASRRALLGLAVVALAASPALPQNPPPRSAPRPEPVAETRLLMDGLNRVNFRGLNDEFKEKPTELKAWTFARGRALLIAETANLLMLRPPRSEGQDAWLERCRDLRDSATRLARFAGSQDYGGCRAALRELAGTCNRCHEAFRVNVPITVEGEKDAPPAGQR